MVTSFNAKDMTSFTNYVLEQIETGQKQPEPNGRHSVTHADFENWKNYKDQVKIVRAKFNCHFIDESGTENNVINMSVVIDGSPENKMFSEYTPSGIFQLYITKDRMANYLFEEGQEYYIDIVKV